MDNRYMVTRVKHVLQATSIFAASPEEAIEKSRKLLRKDWKNIDDRRRKNYRAEQVTIA